MDNRFVYSLPPALWIFEATAYLIVWAVCLPFRLIGLLWVLVRR